MINFTGNPNPNPSLQPVLETPPTITETHRAHYASGPVGRTKIQEELFNAWTSKPVVLFFHAVLS